MSKSAATFVALVIWLSFSLVASAKDPKLTAEELIAKHLQSIGGPEARAAGKSRVAEGKVTFTDRIATSNQLQGAAQFLSQGTKLKCAFSFGAPSYAGEQFVFDGRGHQVAFIAPGTRSRLGYFLLAQSEILREGLLGGSASLAWPLYDLKTRQAKVKYGGLKKIDGRELHDLAYVPDNRTGNGELVIHLYFEPDTFRHVMTVYRLRIHVTDDSLDSRDETIETVEERFGDFHTGEGITLPRNWEIRYRREPGAASELQWQVIFNRFMHNALN